MQNLRFRVVPAGHYPGGRVVSWKNGLKLSRLESRARLIALTGPAEQNRGAQNERSPLKGRPVPRRSTKKEAGWISSRPLEVSAGN